MSLYRWMVPSAKVICVLMVCSCVSLAEANKDDESWKEARAKLDEVITARIHAEVKKAVTLQGVAKQYGLEWPVKKPARTGEELSDLVDRMVESEVEKKFPKTELAKFQDEAKEKYHVYTKGEKVSFVIRGGMGPNATVSGRLRDVNALRVRVDNRWIPRGDMTEEALANYDPEISEKYIKRYMRAQTNRFIIRREDLAAEMREELFPKVMRQAGYIPKGKSMKGATKPENWISRKDALDAIYDRRQKQHAEKVRAQVQEEIYTGHGYVMQDGEWMPKKVAESIVAKLAKMKRQKAKKDEEEDGFSEGDTAGQAGMPGQEGMADAGDPAAEAGMPGAEAGMPGAEAGMPGAEAGMPGAEAGMPGAEAGAGGVPGEGMPGMGMPGAGGGKAK